MKISINDVLIDTIRKNSDKRSYSLKTDGSNIAFTMEQYLPNNPFAYPQRVVSTLDQGIDYFFGYITGYSVDFEGSQAIVQPQTKDGSRHLTRKEINLSFTTFFEDAIFRCLEAAGAVNWYMPIQWHIHTIKDADNED